ncbi:R-spondin-4 [Vanacampus margaritifer]
MRWPLVAVAMSLLCDAIGSERRPDDWRSSCANCKQCSSDNGCVRCAERLFLLLRRRGTSQHGSCLHVCPQGYFGQRGRHHNRCLKCRSANCEHCFGRDFCTQCERDFRLHDGRCLSVCPEGTFARKRRCEDECVPAPWSEWSEWSEWSACLRDGAPCGFSWGRQSRTRGSERTPSPDRTTCPPRSETRKCRIKTRCPAGVRSWGRRGRGRQRQQKPLWMLASSNTSNARNIF